MQHNRLTFFLKEHSYFFVTAFEIIAIWMFYDSWRRRCIKIRMLRQNVFEPIVCNAVLSAVLYLVEYLCQKHKFSTYYVYLSLNNTRQSVFKWYNLHLKHSSYCMASIHFSCYGLDVSWSQWPIPIQPM